MYDEFMGGGTYVSVRSIFDDVFFRVSLHGHSLRLRGVADLLAHFWAGLAPAAQRSPSAGREDHHLRGSLRTNPPR